MKVDFFKLKLGFGEWDSIFVVVVAIVLEITNAFFSPELQIRNVIFASWEVNDVQHYLDRSFKISEEKVVSPRGMCFIFPYVHHQCVRASLCSAGCKSDQNRGISPPVAAASHTRLHDSYRRLIISYRFSAAQNLEHLSEWRQACTTSQIVSTRFSLHCRSLCLPCVFPLCPGRVSSPALLSW